MRRSVILGSCLAVALGAAGCQDPTTGPAATTTETASSFTLQSSNVELESLDLGQIQLPESVQMTDQHLAEMARRAINPDDYVCPASTPISDWFFGKLVEVASQEPAIYTLLFLQARADIIPTYDAVFFQTTATPQYFGYNGEYTEVLLKTEKSTKRFWDIPSADIQMIGMHGTMLLDVQRSATAYAFTFGLSPALAMFYATTVRNALLASQTLNGGNHPVFSFNALAFSAPGYIDKIVMGDGVMAGFADLGFGDVAPQAIYTHEFAHHIQFENGYFEDALSTTGTQAERTRYSELMADAMSAFYLTHKRGGAMNQKRVKQFLEIFFQIGDCSFDNAGHHGTPNQRMKAAQFGFDLADQASKKGHILTSQEVYELFVAAYPQMIAPDAP